MDIADEIYIGCGKFFEGTAEEMHKALNETLAALPGGTKVYVSLPILLLSPLLRHLLLLPLPLLPMRSSGTGIRSYSTKRKQQLITHSPDMNTRNRTSNSYRRYQRQMQSINSRASRMRMNRRRGSLRLLMRRYSSNFPLSIDPYLLFVNFIPPYPILNLSVQTVILGIWRYRSPNKPNRTTTSS